MLYAAQIFARELKLADTRRDTPHLVACCSALADLIDFLYDMASVAPRWGKCIVYKTPAVHPLTPVLYLSISPHSGDLAGTLTTVARSH